MFQTDIIRPGDLSARERDAWSAFCAATPVWRSPLLSAEFADAVAGVRSDVAVAVFRRAGAPIGFLAHHRRPGGFARPVGAPWSDYHALVAAPDSGLLGADALHGAGIKAYRFGGLIDPYGAFVDTPSTEREAFVIDPPESGAPFWEALRAASPKRFKNMRRLEHKLAREVGEVALVGGDRDWRAFETLLAWKRDQLRRSGLHDVLAPAWSQALMASLFEQTDGPLQGFMLTLRAGGQPVGGHFGVRLGEHFHPWIAAYDPALAAYSPGLTLMSEAIRAMPSLGLSSYDLSAGSDHYKKPFASRSTMVLEGAAGVRPLGLPSPVRRLQRRLDQIASVELSLAGRLRGVAVALAAAPRRLAAGSGEAV